MNDIRDIKPLLTMDNPWLPAALAALGLLLILLGIYLWWRLRPKKAPVVEEAPQVSPYELAQQLLQGLADERLIEQDLVAEFYLRLSRIVREFLESLFGFPATGFTSRELLRALTEKRVGAQLVQLVDQFYQHCDLVKFTSNRASQQEMQEALAKARRLVDETQRLLGNQRGSSMSAMIIEQDHVAVR